MRLDHLLSKGRSRGCITVQLSRAGYMAGDGEQPCTEQETGKEYLVAMRLRDTPVPIPNTMVKTQAADGTMLGTAWESRRLPD